MFFMFSIFIFFILIHVVHVVSSIFSFRGHALSNRSQLEYDIPSTVWCQLRHHKKYHLLQNNYSFDALQAYCFGINLKL